ncbi:MAG: DUF58 domain-containing protein [Pseudomonadales bacterium]|nr:DUF58 domain-containing protein [Pseudomonadales bacterium]
MDTTASGRFQFLKRWALNLRERWLVKQVPAANLVSLHRRNIFILPTRQGMLFFSVALIIFVAAINYSLSLAFALAFLMISLFLLGILHTFYNLHGLQLQGIGGEPGFCGESGVFVLLLQAGQHRQHEAIELGFPGEATINIKLAANTRKRVTLALNLNKRGLLRAPRVKIRSVYPLGLWQAWSHLDLALEGLVYPAPVSCTPVQASAFNRHEEEAEEGGSPRPGAEDFHGLRDYRSGDSLKQIAWKSLARGQGLKIKQFVDTAADSQILDWDMFSGLDKETRLSALCHLVLQRSSKDQATGLQMPGLAIETGNGPAHQHRLLEVLALWP